MAIGDMFVWDGDAAPPKLRDGQWEKLTEVWRALGFEGLNFNIDAYALLQQAEADGVLARMTTTREAGNIPLALANDWAAVLDYLRARLAEQALTLLTVHDIAKSIRQLRAQNIPPNKNGKYKLVVSPEVYASLRKDLLFGILGGAAGVLRGVSGEDVEVDVVEGIAGGAVWRRFG